MISITAIYQLIPDSLKQSAVDALVETIVERGEGLLSEAILNKIKGLRSDAAFRRQFDAGLQRGLQRFVDEYQLQDEDLVAAIATDTALFAQPEMQQALLTVLQQPGQYLVEEREALTQSFVSVLPQRINRERVDRAVTFLLKCLAQEVWHLPELQPIYSLEFQRITAESTHEQLAVQKAQLAALDSLNVGVREALLQLTDALSEQKQLAAGAATAALPAPRPAVYHNLPQPDYGEFVGREKEIRQIFDLLRPYPHSRHHLIVIDGIGGIGKSTLALEVAHRCLHASRQAAREEQPEQDRLVRLRQILLDRFSEDELRTLCFDMALDYEMLPGQGKGGKARELVAYLERRNRLTELIENLYRLRPDIRDTDLFTTDTAKLSDAEQFDAIIWTSAKSSVLTADGIISRRQVLQTLDDIYTAVAIALQRDDITRASVDQQDELVRRALARQRTLLIVDNLETVDDENVITFDAQQLYARAGGVPLATSWSIAQIGFGYPTETVLKRLRQPQEDIARFCFDEAISLIRQHPARKLLLALSLFETGPTRQILGQVAGLADDVLMRDEGLVQLERLSLVNKENGRFTLLPLTRDYATAERLQHPIEDRELVESWLSFYIELVQKDGNNHARWYNFDILTEEGQNILAAFDFTFSTGRVHEVLVLITAVFWYLDSAGRWTDTLKYGRQAFDLAVLENRSADLTGICRQLGWLYSQLGQFDQAGIYFQHQHDWTKAQYHFQRVLDWAEQMQEKQRGYHYDMALGTRGNMAVILYELVTTQAEHMGVERLQNYHIWDSKACFVQRV